MGWGRTWTSRKRSPGRAPPWPGSPLPATRTREPSRTPAGILTSICCGGAPGLACSESLCWLPRNASSRLISMGAATSRPFAASKPKPFGRRAPAPRERLPGRAPPMPPKADLRVGSSKKHLEEVGEAADSLRPRSFILDVEPLESGGESGTALRLCDPLVLLPVRPELIVFASLLGVRDDGVGLVDLFEANLGPAIPRLTSGWCFRASRR